MDNWRRLAHGPIDGRGHMQVRGNYDRRCLRLKLARRHGVLRRRRLLVRVPLLHLHHVLGVVAVRRTILLGVEVGLGVGIVVDRRVRLGILVVMVLLRLPASGRHVRAWHHGRQATVLPLQSVAGWGPTLRCEATVECGAATDVNTGATELGQGGMGGAGRARRRD